MKKQLPIPLLPLLLLTLLLVPPLPLSAEDDASEPSLLGPVSREEMEAAHPDWVAAQIEASIDSDAALALAAVPAGAEVAIYLGTWCSDSKRELSRFFRALDVVGGMVPFPIHYVAVDRRDKRPPELLQELNLLYVPTFIVIRDGQEVGRVVESSPNGIEKDLLSLLDGSATGVLSGREDSIQNSEFKVQN